MTGARCVACGAAGLRTVERVSAAQIADGFRREDLANGQPAVAERRRAALLRLLPESIRFDQCPSCGTEISDPCRVWSAEEYPEDQSYPPRWEFVRCLEDLGPAPLDVLEIGCGPGQLLSRLAARGHRAIGIDFSKSAVAVARAAGLPAFEGSLDTIGEHVPAATRFDAIVLFHVIEHVPDPDALFASIAPWARPGARLFISCPGPRRYSRLIREQQVDRSDYWDHPPLHVFRWTLKGLEAVAARHGWAPIAAIEEPLDWTGAASHIGVARAIHRGILGRPLRRRLAIAGAWASLAAAPAAFRAGTSIYFSARRG
ncbi:MAG TPA: class I SAM-dependent methyltransferase [Vicinamibacterales bacterium]|nr:class I SAM-dependent methyltransferase [Vicinamibacterales bacterium]